MAAIPFTRGDYHLVTAVPRCEFEVRYQAWVDSLDAVRTARTQRVQPAAMGPTLVRWVDTRRAAACHSVRCKNHAPLTPPRMPRYLRL